MEKSITTILTIFDVYKEIAGFKASVEEHKKMLNAYKTARKYRFISDLFDGKTKYEENIAKIRSLELQLSTLMKEAPKGHSEDEIEKKNRRLL
ncbi:hypothetical protein MKA58_06530 [[Clostridium] innocuum]|nr:hypothetical protein [[Clostridium] innocuum]